MIILLCRRQRVREIDIKNLGTINSFNLGKQRGSDFWWKTISLVFSVLTLSLFLVDQSRIWENSDCKVIEEFCCDTRKVLSSTYLRIALKDEIGLRSMIQTIKRHGPIMDPCLYNTGCSGLPGRGSSSKRRQSEYDQ